MKRQTCHAPRSATFRCVAPLIGWALLGSATSASANEPFQVQLRLLDHNVFGFDENNCALRATGFGHIVANAEPAYDIVALNEFYNIGPFAINICDALWLANSILCTGRYTNPDNSVLFEPDDGSPDGGLGIYTLGSICETHELMWSFQDFVDPRQGALFTRVAIPNSTVTLDVYVVHTHSSGDGCDRCCHEQQLLELNAFIQAQSARSGNPVIVMGDFNIGGPPACCGNEGFEDITSILSAPRDLWWEANPCGDPPRMYCGDPIAACDDGPEGCCHLAECEGFDSPLMNVCVDEDPGNCSSVFCLAAPAPEECDGWGGYTRTGCQNEIDPPPNPERIDYIFVLEHPAFSSSAFEVELVDARVADWVVRVSSENYIHVSDHLGLEATINIYGMSSVWVDSFQQVEGSGTSCDPFASLEDAVAAVPAGDRILLRHGLYPEHIIIDRPCRLESIAGDAIIGF